MQRAYRLGFLLALIGVSALGAGCGRTVGSPQAGASSSATPGASGSPTSGQVTLTLDKQQYAAGDTIAVTIHNGLSQTIWTADHQTNCTVVTAEHLQGGQWQGIQNCRLMTPTRMVPLSGGSTMSAGLSAAQDFLADSGWPPGAYRVTFTYVGSDRGTGEPSGVARSVQFTIS